MSDELPARYPLANASEEEIEAWAAAASPPYSAMRKALPWLARQDELDCWLAVIRDIMQRPDCARAIREAFPMIMSLPLPPRRSSGNPLA